MSSEKVRQYLQNIYGYRSFRKGQEEIVKNILEGRDTLGVMPTGGGKSICYQIPALMMDGVTLVISPLISLMKDQVDNLQQLGIPAASVNSTLSASETERCLRETSQGAYKLLYVAPERFESPRFQTLLSSLPVSLVTIDEAHCISQWGHDFRPSYRRMAEQIRQLPQHSVIAAFTATATREVRREIVDLLSIGEHDVFVTGFQRKNLSFSVLHGEEKRAFVLRYLRERPEQSGIIYCSTRKEVDHLHQFLLDRGWAAGKYHAGLSEEERRDSQEQFAYDRIQAMVATNAFGMGIDKSNVRFVIHYNMPRNLESYYQEAGRAGRDGEESECTLLFNPRDVHTQRYLIEQSQLPPERKAREHEKLQAIHQYCHTQQCFQHVIIRYFGDSPGETCGKCGNCTDTGEKEDVTVEAQKIFSCIKRMRERFGVSLIAKVLKGSADKRVRELGLTRLPTYGLLKEQTSKEITNRIHRLIADGYLSLTEGTYPVVQLNDQAVEVLKGEQQVLQRVTKRQPQVQVKNELFESLRGLRREISEREQIPPYMIFHDSTLKELSRVCPVEESTMLAVKGIGEQKFQRYGQEFLSFLRSYIEKNGRPLATTVPSSASSSTGSGEASHLTSYRLFLDGESPEAIAAHRNLSTSTVENHLLRCGSEGHSVDWNRLIPEGQEEIIRQKIEEIGAQRLKPLKEALPNEISYTAIKAVIAKGMET
ncbi:DNA helicase RecQ [Paludifilum halophilum]|uniref:DNA helicase RecQ n=1 Tax=Paludifilum halophilum TaxID=1642702 RepID=UPI001F0A2E20|nr:DNA helicase RecQ [Paludifilum halophilum]